MDEATAGPLADITGSVRSPPASSLSVAGKLLFLLIYLAALVIPSLARAQSCPIEAGGQACGVNHDPGSVEQRWVPDHHVGNPIDVITGNKYQRESDYQAFGSPLAFHRQYNSALAEHDVRLGHGWRHSYDVVLTRTGNDSLRIVQADGRRIEFNRDAVNPGEFRAASRGDGKIIETDQHIWLPLDGRRFQFRGSFLMRIDYADDAEQALDLAYAHGRLARVSDQHGRAIELIYTLASDRLRSYDDAASGDLPGHLASIKLPDGTFVHYGYDQRGNLTSTKYPEGYDVTYEYNRDEWPHHLMRRQAPESDRAWSYDSMGRVDRYTPGADEPELQLDYESADLLDTNGSTWVSEAGGRSQQFHWQVNPTTGERQVVTVIESECFSCEVNVFNFPLESSDILAESEHPPLEHEGVNQDEKFSVVETNGRQTTIQLADGSQAIVIADRVGKLIDVEKDGLSLRQLFRAAAEGQLAPPDLNDPDSSGRDSTGTVSGSANQIEFGSAGTTSDAIQSSAPQSNKRSARQSTESAVDKDAESLSSDDQALSPDFLDLLELDDLASSLKQHNAPPLLRRNGNAQGATRFCKLPPGKTCTELKRDIEMAKLSDCAYPTHPCTTNWIEVKPAELGLDQVDLEERSFRAHIFKDQQTGEYVVAFRGTETDDWGDIWADIVQFEGGAQYQYKKARDLAQKIEDLNDGIEVSYTGHSLGGGLAATASATTGVESIVFNSAALKKETARKLRVRFEDAESAVRNISVDGDIVTSVQAEPQCPVLRSSEGCVDSHGRKLQLVDESVPGSLTIIPQPYWAWQKMQKENYKLATRSMRMHFMESVVESLLTLGEESCGLPR